MYRSYTVKNSYFLFLFCLGHINTGDSSIGIVYYAAVT